jgi:histidinol-phosphate aminotransferase
MAKNIIVRDRSRVALCFNCIRITIGTPEENKKLINALKEL